MVVIKWLLLSLIISTQIFGQFDWFPPDSKNNAKYYLWNAVTGSATISEDMVQIFGSEARTKSNKLDTLSTKRSPQRWMNWNTEYIREFDFTESADGWTRNVTYNQTIGDSTGCLCASTPNENTIAEYAEQSFLSYSGRDGVNTVHIKFDVYSSETSLSLAGLIDMTTAFNDTTFSTTINTWESKDFLIPVTMQNNYPITSIQIYKLSPVTFYLKNVSITFVESDSSQGLSKILYDLSEDQLFTYYHSILVYTTDNDTDYYKGDDETFTTLLIPPSELSVEADTGKAYLEWQINSLVADSVHIERKLFNEPIDSFVQVVKLPSTETAYLDSPLVRKAVYSYRIRNNRNTYSTYSDTVNVSVEEWIPVLEFSPSIADFGLVYFSEDSIVADIDTTLGSNSIPIIESYTSKTNGLSALTSIVIDRPTGVEANDLMLIMVMAENDTSGATPQFTMQPDWTYLDESGNATQAVRTAVFYKISDSTEDATDTVTINMGNANSVGFWLRVSNVNTSDPINTSNFTLSSGNALSHIIPELTTDADNCLSIAGLAFDGADYLGTLTNGYAWRTNQDTISANYGLAVGITGIWGSRDITSAGVTTDDTVSVGSSDGAAYFMIALNGITTATTYDTTFVADRDTISVTILNNNTTDIDIDSTGINSIFTYTDDTIPATISARDSAHFKVFIPKDVEGGFNGRIKFYTEFTEQDYPLAVTVFLPDTIAPDVPTNVSLTGGNKTALLEWDNGLEECSKYILWSLNSSNDMVIGDSVSANETSYTITSLDSGSVYKAGLISYDNHYNLSDTSATDTALVVGTQASDTTPPTLLTDITATGYVGYIEITGTQGGDLNDVYSYTIMKSIENPSFTAMHQIAHPRPPLDSVLKATVLTGTTFTYRDYNVNDGSLYSYKVGNWDASGNGNWWSALNDTAIVPYADTTEGEPETGIARYVSLNGGSPYDGLTYETAYDYPSIPFATLPTNTILYFDGGEDSVVYNAPLTIGTSNITLAKGTSAGHNGRVIIEAPSYMVGTGITIWERSNIAITNLEIRNFNRGIQIDSRVAGGVDSIKIQNCVLINGEFSIDTDGRLDTTGNNCRNIWILDNRIEYIPSGNPNYVQTDGLSIYYTRNLFVEGNVFINRNIDGDDTHNDFAQATYNTNQYYFNNLFYIGNARQVGQNGVQLGNSSAGDFYFANNVFMMGQYTQQAAIWAELYTRHWGNMRVVNNTFIGASPRNNYLGGYPDAVYKNNLFWSITIGTYTTRPFFYIEPEDGSAANLTIENNNFYYSASQIFMQATGSFTRPASNGWYNTSTYSPTLSGFTYTPTSYTNCSYSEEYTDYLLTSSSTREWEQGEVLEEADFPTNTLAPDWFSAWDYVRRTSNGTVRTQWDIGAR